MFPANRRAAVWRSFPAFMLAVTLCCSGLDAGHRIVADEKPAAGSTDDVLAGTRPLTGDEDFASLMVDGIDRFLLREWNAVDVGLSQNAPAGEHPLSKQQRRAILARSLGTTEPRVGFDAPELVSTRAQSALIGSAETFDVFRVRWPVLHDPSPDANGLVSVTAEGLLLVPKGDRALTADVVAVPDADTSPEQFCGLTEGLPAGSQTARRLAAAGFRVLVPTIVSRQVAKRNGRAELSNREYLHRPAFEVGRTLLGYEVQKVLAGVDWFARDSDAPSIGIAGNGEGGFIALLAAALDDRVNATFVSGDFGSRGSSWKQPLERNIMHLRTHFQDSVLAEMSSGPVMVEADQYPQVTVNGGGAAPAVLETPPRDQVAAIFADYLARIRKSDSFKGALPELHPQNGPEDALVRFAERLAGGKTAGSVATRMKADWTAQQRPKPTVSFDSADVTARHTQQFNELNRHTQRILRYCDKTREQFRNSLDTSGEAAYATSVGPHRERFYNDVIGQVDQPLLPPNAQSRRSWQTDKWDGFEVRLDVFPDVFAYGVLLLPKDLKPGERRPVVVCQHGLEGRPTDIFLNDHAAYHDFAAKLCEKGYVVFAPQNPYIFTDRFRTLQRKANPLGKSLFSFIIPQHQQIVDWLQEQPFVDPDQVAFYGLSYGGKSAMRIPAVVTDYCLSICSADFNEWVLKNASTTDNFSYVFTGEYEIFEFDLGHTFNYAEMAALICPRPFMVERGHFDGVGVDEWVAFEFAKVRNLYAARLKIPDRCEIEWFDGPHTINGQGTYRFLDRHLDQSWRTVGSSP